MGIIRQTAVAAATLGAVLLSGHAAQVAVFGAVTVALNTTADLIVVVFAARARSLTTERPHLVRRLREGSGVIMCGLGISLLFVRRAP